MSCASRISKCFKAAPSSPLGLGGGWPGELSRE